MALSLVSINIEWNKHLDTVLPFLKERNADVVCVQELLEKDILLFEEICGPCLVYAPGSLLNRENGLEIEGEAIFSHLSVEETNVRYYAGSRESVRLNDEKSDPGTHALVMANVEKSGVAYRVGTTHLTWTEKGLSTEKQLQDLDKLFSELDTIGEFVLVGDFNAPRGRETFAALAARYKDNIPTEYETSLDPVLHTKTGRPLSYMVDGLFTTSGYSAKDVSLQFGVSDHAAIVATIEKTA